MDKQSPVILIGFREDMSKKGAYEVSSKGRSVCQITKVVREML